MLNKKNLRRNIIPLIIFCSHLSIGLYLMSIKEMTGYLLFGLWEFPFFSIVEKFSPTGNSYELQNFVVLFIGGFFWGFISFLVVKIFKKRESLLSLRPGRPHLEEGEQY